MGFGAGGATAVELSTLFVAACPFVNDEGKVDDGTVVTNVEDDKGTPVAVAIGDVVAADIV